MNHKKPGPTIYDVAQTAGVSPATVSRVLNGTGYPVSEQARERVLKAAQSLSYAVKGRLLPSERDVVVMLPNLSNPYYATLLSGIEVSLRMFGLNTLLMNTKGDIALERQLIAELCRRDPVRLIICPVCDDIRHLQPLICSDTPMIVLEQPEAGQRSTIVQNFYKSGELATAYLLKRGLRRIAFLGAPLNRYSRTQLFEGYRDTLERAGILCDPQLVFLSEEDPSLKSEHALRNDNSPFYMGIQLTDRMIKKCSVPPQGVVCGNDMAAIGVLHRLQQLGIQVPSQISVIGCDNIYSAEVSQPPLTTIDQRTYELGSMAVDILYGSMMDPARKHVNAVLEPRLVVRGSVV